MIVDAMALSRGWLGSAGYKGMVTFVDRKKVKPTMVRSKPLWGLVFRKAGFIEQGETKSGLLALICHIDAMPMAQGYAQKQPGFFY